MKITDKSPLNFFKPCHRLTPSWAISALKLCDTLLTRHDVNCWTQFSSVKRVKLYLYKRTSEEFLSGIALMNMHRNTPISEECICLLTRNRAERLLLMSPCPFWSWLRDWYKLPTNFDLQVSISQFRSIVLSNHKPTLKQPKATFYNYL